MMRVALYGITAASGTIVQTAWLAYVPLAGGVADPLLPLVMTIGLLHGSEEGALYGAGIGLLRDVMSGSPLGLGMVSYVCVGFAAGLTERVIALDSLWMPAVGGVLLTALGNTVWLGAAHLVGLVNAPITAMLRATAGSACYNGAIAVPLFHGLRRLDAALVRMYERSRA